MLRNIKKIALIALSLTAVMPAAAQDLLANQAPIDRKMRAVDSIQLNQMLESEVASQSPAAQLYDDWNNIYAHRQTSLPDSFLIDLRGFAMPSPSTVITSNFGPRWGRQHKGLDIKLNTGDTIYAAFTGKVRIVRSEAKGSGKYVVIRHNNGLETIYGHLSRPLVDEYDQVFAGDVIGLGGHTGRSTGSHLHWEVRYLGNALNPEEVIDFNIGKPKNSEYVIGIKAIKQQRAEQAAMRYHTVKQGDTLSGIARRYHTTVKRLCQLNKIKETSILRLGQKIRVQ